MKEDLDVIFIQETKVLASYFDFPKFFFGFPNCLVVDRVGLGGGLMLLWKGETKLKILKYSHDFIHGRIVEGSNRDIKGMFKGVYGYPETKKNCKETWILIKSTCRDTKTQDLILRDFNEILG